MFYSIIVIMKSARSVTLDEDVLEAVERTRNGSSVSKRINQLIKRGLQAERQQDLAREAADFFQAPAPEERRERRAYVQATRRALAKD